MTPIDSSMRQRVTQSDVARVAGVHNTTVSLSLRNCPSIPEATRKRIRAIADELGYFPDPTLQALVAYRKGRISSRPRETLAYITNGNSCWGWRAMPAHERAFMGAQRKATELGYKFEHFWLREPGMNQRRMSDVLYHRGINGVLVAAQEEFGEELSEIDWSRLSAVKIGCFPQTPALHRVTNNHSGMLKLAMRRIVAAGYQRIGMVVTQAWDDVADQAWSAGFHFEQSRMAAAARIPVLRFATDRNELKSARPGHQLSNDEAAFLKWYRSHRPDVIVGLSPATLGRIVRTGLSIPRDVAYVDLSLERTDSGVAGIRQNGEFAGSVATTMLVAQIQQNQFGLPAVTTSTMVDGAWVDGASMPTARARVSCVENLDIRAYPVEGPLLAAV
jgi:LacI family transcriptional regulator